LLYLKRIRAQLLGKEYYCLKKNKFWPGGVGEKELKEKLSITLTPPFLLHLLAKKIPAIVKSPIAFGKICSKKLQHIKTFQLFEKKCNLPNHFLIFFQLI
jgi:hypothetical protein